MSFLSSLTNKQRTIIVVLLALNVLCLYAGIIPVALSLTQPTEILADADAPPESSDNLALAAAPAPTPSLTATPPQTPSRTPSPPRTPIPLASIPTHTLVPRVVPTSVPAPRFIAPQTLANLELDPTVTLSSQTTFFTSACFGDGANLLQDRDFMAPADWSGSPDRKCIFGFNVKPADGMPIGRYSVFGVEGQPRFYIIPPEAFAHDRQRVKQLSQMHLIVDPTQGCGALGALGITADGQTYQCSACAFLRPGGVCPATTGSKSLVLPTNRHYVLEPDITGGAHGLQNFPLIFFRQDFSLYFTGRDGYAPPRTYFESSVDTLAPHVRAKTTAEMTNQEIREFASQFDRAPSNENPLRQLASLERKIPPISAAPIALKSRERGSISFAATPGTVLSSIVWRVKPLNNLDSQQFLETNLCLDLNGEEVCFTGVEDFAHCAFYTPCQTGYTGLTPTEGGGYRATRYFLPGAAPLIRDGTITARFQAPDVGAVLEMDVEIRTRTVSANLP